MTRSKAFEMLVQAAIGRETSDTPAADRSIGAETLAADVARPPVDDRVIFVDLPPATLIEQALARNEGMLDASGALVVETGAYTGRAPQKRYIVDGSSVQDTIAWGSVNRPIGRKVFERVRDGVAEHLAERDLFVVRALSGADRDHARRFLVCCERASQALFIRDILVRPTAQERSAFGAPDFTVLVAPGYRCDPARDGTDGDAAIIIDFEDRVVVIAGTGYSGEIKKSVFSVMNLVLPLEDDVLTMHCSATMNPLTRETAVIFGLSGTGKTTLSADPARQLIGDDEHGWGPRGIFNLEGGCYAKCGNLDPARESEIFDAIRFGAVSENVVLRADRSADYDDLSLTGNTRACYPIEHIAGARLDGMGPTPRVILFLTCDAFGVLPPIARLTRDAALYHFVTGFTAKVSGTEQGIDEPAPTFSSLFGEPFMPLDPLVYARMLGERLRDGATRVYLVNTGWVAGPCGSGHRIGLACTRRLVRAAIDGAMERSAFEHDPIFNVDVPTSCPGVSDELLNPRGLWSDPQRYDRAARRLARLFRDNFDARYAHLPQAIRDAGPTA